jgi:hypothetical protein
MLRTVNPFTQKSSTIILLIVCLCVVGAIGIQNQQTSGSTDEGLTIQLFDQHMLFGCEEELSVAFCLLIAIELGICLLHGMLRQIRTICPAPQIPPPKNRKTLPAPC